jgi:predicted acylesterase/phospholipase RssA
MSDEASPGEVNKPRVFQLGLALAGAISAGAYTAGVLDFLFQALSEWDAHRGEKDVPDHWVVLKVLAGASAGAITGALGAIALARGLQRTEFPEGYLEGCYKDTYPTHQKYKCVLPSLYRAWVVLPAMIGANGAPGLLDTDDIDPKVKDDVDPEVNNDIDAKVKGSIDAKVKAGTPIVRSLLNASLLDTIKRTVIEPSDDQIGTSVTSTVSFVAQRLHVYITISNMRGIPFRVAFGRNSYGMQTMGDRVHYVVKDLGSRDLSVLDSWVERDAQGASLDISVTSLPQVRGRPLGPWDLYGTSALASSAFPVGLASRNLSFPWKFYLKRCYPIPMVDDKVEITPTFPEHEEQETGDFVFESVDGGVVNNSPFDYAQYALMGGQARLTDGRDVDKAIVMIAPFPEPPEFPPRGSPSASVTGILGALFPALVNQARFRTADLAPAIDERDFSRFLVAPLRRIPRTAESMSPKDPPAEPYAIACGLLGGFGGFLNEEFRAHDYQLGRRNCQQFLRTAFHVPGNNMIVGRSDAKGMRPIVPLLGTAADPVRLPRWPQMTEHDFDLLCERTAKRIDKVVPQLINAQTHSVKLRWALRFGWWLFLSSRAIEFVRWTVRADLVRRSQIRGWDAPVDQFKEIIATHHQTAAHVQAIIAELANPAFDFRTANGIAKKTHRPAKFVEAVLQELKQPQTPKTIRAWQNEYGFTLLARKPGWFNRRGPVKWFNHWWNAPAVD